MAESSTCLMQPFSYTSVLSSSEPIEGNPIHALGQSISFGRFASESLSWEKWSTFSHKRYVEEAERYSRPGSVAEMKAFFEAHYKKMAEKKAAEAVLLDQANAVSTDPQQSDDVTDVYSSNSGNMDLEKFVEPQGESPKQIIHSDIVLDKDEAQLKVDVAVELEKEHTETYDLEKSPLKSSEPAKIKDDSFATPKCETTARNSSERQRSAHKWLKPLNFTPVKELNLLSSTVKRKIGNSRIDENRPDASKDCSTPFKTPVVARNGSSASTTPRTEKQTKKDEAAPGSKTATKRRSLAIECSKFLNACKNKLQSPKISTPFRFRTEERAARRREKLEDKFNAEKAQNVPPKTKLKGIAETDSRKWRPTFCFSGGPLPGDHNEMRRAEDTTKKVPTARPLPQHRTTAWIEKNSNFLGKSFQATSRPRGAENIPKARENTPPNIQHL